MFGAHHDAITGSESDQVYLDLLTTLARRARHRRRRTAVLARPSRGAGRCRRRARSDRVQPVDLGPSLITSRCDVTDVPGRSVEVVGPDGAVVPSVLDDVVRTPTRRSRPPTSRSSRDVPGIGHSAGWQVRAASEDAVEWLAVPDRTTIENEQHRPHRRPGPRRLCAAAGSTSGPGANPAQPGEVGNELVVLERVPRASGVPRRAVAPRRRTADRAPLGAGPRPRPSRASSRRSGERLTITGSLGRDDATRSASRCGTATTASTAARRSTGSSGSDHLLRVRWPVGVAGALPVSEVGNAVIGRGFALPRRGLRRSSVDAGQPGGQLVRPVVDGPGARVGGATAGTAPSARSASPRLVAADHDSAAAAAASSPSRWPGRASPRRPRSAPARATADLAVDSNLPDVADQRRRPGRQRLHRRGARRGRRAVPHRARQATRRARARRGSGCPPNARCARSGSRAPT